MEKPTRIAVVGTGFFSQFHLEAWARLPDAQVVALCDIDPNSATDTAKKYGIESIYTDSREMLSKELPDLVDIVTPPPTHLPLIEQCASLHLDTICQKPLAPTIEQAQEIAQIAEKACIQLVVHENFRFMPWFLKAKELIDSGELGNIYAMQFRFRPGDGQGNNAYELQPRFRNLDKLLIHETGIHYVDVFRFLLGEAKSVYANLQQRNQSIAGEDSGYVLFELEHGRRALLDANRLSDHATKDSRVTMGEGLVEGSNATLQIDGSGRLWLRAFGESNPREIHYDWTNENFGGDCVYLCQKHILQTLRSGDTPSNTVQAFLRNIEIEEAIYESNTTGRKITLP